MANIIISSGDILQASTQVLSDVHRRQTRMNPSNKQTKLYDKYRKRLNEVQATQAPMGDGKP